MVTSFELFDWQVRYLDIYLFYICEWNIKPTHLLRCFELPRDFAVAAYTEENAVLISAWGPSKGRSSAGRASAATVCARVDESRCTGS